MAVADRAIEAAGRLRRWIQNPVRAVLLLGSLAIGLVLLSTEIYLSHLRKHELRHAAVEASSMSRIIGDQTTRALQGVHLVVGATVDRISQLEHGRLPLGGNLVHAMLVSRIEGMPHISALFVVDRHGKVVNASDEFPASGVLVADRDYFQFHRANPKSDIFIGAPLVNRMGGKWTVHISHRIDRPDGSFAGVVVAALNLEFFEQLHSLNLEYITPIALYLNDGRLLTRTPRNEEMLGRTFTLPPHPAAAGAAPRIERIDGGAPGVTVYGDITGYPLTLAVSSLDAAALTAWQQNAVTLRLGAGTVAAFIALITLLLVRELKREQALAENLAQTGQTLRAMVDTAMDAIVSVDTEQRIVLFNPAAENMFGCSAEIALGAPLSRFLPERYRVAHARHIDGFHDRRAVKRPMSNEVVGLRANGEEFPVETTVSQLTVAGRTLFTAVLRDISERRRAEIALTATNAELRRLSESLIMVRESERTRIARELHDELGQQLMRLRLDLSSLAAPLHKSHPELANKVAVMKGLLADTVASVRRITTELRPPMLDDLGLVAAVEWLVSDFSKRSDVGMEIDIDPAIDACEPGMATAVYRILQEALTNAVRHASASQVSIALQIEDDALRLAIEDNGCGIHTSSGAYFCAGNGLVGMRERVLMFSGRIDVTHSGSGGVAIEVHLPLRQQSTKLSSPAPAAEDPHRETTT